MSLLRIEHALSDAAADQLIEAAHKEARRLSVPISVAIVDASGILLRFARQANAILVSVETARDKAYAALSFGIATHEWAGIIKDDLALLHGIPALPRHTTLGGGLPIRVDDRLVGGIGISGGHYLQDIAIGEAALLSLVGDITTDVDR
jgi:uncharacterized protein GlcG (DUF336 family)